MQIIFNVSIEHELSANPKIFGTKECFTILVVQYLPTYLAKTLSHKNNPDRPTPPCTIWSFP